MAKLSLNFHGPTGMSEPTENEIDQLGGLALDIKMIIKALGKCALEGRDKNAETADICMGVCNVLELLMDPLVDYMMNYAEAPQPMEE